MSFEFFVSFRYLRGRKRQAFISVNTLISVAGVTVGVMAMMVVLAVMTGFGSDIRSRILGMNAHITVMAHSGRITDYGQLLKTLETVDGVAAASPYIHSQVMLRSGFYASGAILKGIDPERAGQVLDLEKNMEGARLSALSADGAAEAAGDHGESTVPGVILGKELARSLVTEVGEVLYVLSPFAGALTPTGARLPKMRKLQVLGLFDSGMYDFDTSFAYVSIPSAQRLLGLKDAVQGIEVKVKDIYAVSEVSDKIRQILGPDYWTQDWMQKNRNFFSALKLEKTVMFIILVLIILVAAFNIVSTLIMMVMDKTKEIAILKSMGATGKSIMKIFMLDGLIIGGIGTILGLLGGALLCFLLQRYEFVKLPSDVYYISTLPVRVEPLDVVLVALSALAISFLATLYPSYQASRLEPATALRYE